jgi:hypothetical protein
MNLHQVISRPGEQHLFPLLLPRDFEEVSETLIIADLKIHLTLVKYGGMKSKNRRKGKAVQKIN